MKLLTKINKLLIWRGSELLLLVVMISLVVYLDGRIKTVRQELKKGSIAVEQELESGARAVGATVELNKRRTEIDQLSTLAPFKNEVGKVVEELGHLARQRQVELRVPSVTEVTGQEQYRGLGEVRLSAVVSGWPNELLRFFYAVEHLPYLLTVVDWRLVIEERFTGIGLVAPVSGLTEDSLEENKNTELSQATLSMEIILLVQKDEED